MAEEGRTAALYIMTLPKVVHGAPEWQASMEDLLLGAERGRPITLARSSPPLDRRKIRPHLRATPAARPTHRPSMSDRRMSSAMPRFI